MTLVGQPERATQNRVVNLLRDELKTFSPESRADLMEMEDEVRRVLKRYFSRVRGRRPLIVPHVFEM